MFRPDPRVPILYLVFSMACKVPSDARRIRRQPMQRPPLMFAAIVIGLFLFFLLVIAVWQGVFPGPYLHVDKASP